MIVDWWRRRREERRRAARLRWRQTAGRQLDEFVADIADLTAPQRAALGAVGRVHKAQMEEDAILTAGLFETASHEADADAEATMRLQMTLEQASFSFRIKGKGVDAMAVALWLHTLRGIVYPELRQPARRLWGLLAEGAPHLDEAWAAVEQRRGQPVGDALRRDCLGMPSGLRDGLDG